MDCNSGACQGQLHVFFAPVKKEPEEEARARSYCIPRNTFFFLNISRINFRLFSFNIFLRWKKNKLIIAGTAG